MVSLREVFSHNWNFTLFYFSIYSSISIKYLKWHNYCFLIKFAESSRAIV